MRTWRLASPRLIPAHAGKTLVSSLISIMIRAHPRACGENLIAALPQIITTGSSPRMRGKQHARRRMDSKEGLIPAHAGKTDKERVCSSVSQAHPRACGENLLSQSNGAQQVGSSPRMRGKPPHRQCTRIHSGLIPAHAGKTVHEVHLKVLHGAHPRACGENPPTGSTKPRAAGSSPRMRGKLMG